MRLKQYIVRFEQVSLPEGKERLVRALRLALNRPQDGEEPVEAGQAGTPGALAPGEERMVTDREALA